MKKGHIDGVLFNKPTYTAIGDPFKEAAMTMMRKEDRSAQIAVGNEKPFKPQNHVKHPVKSAYEHMKEFDQVQKNFRSEENPREVLIHPRNFLTNPPKAGKVGKNTSFGGVVPYMEDDFNRPKTLATEARLAGKELEQDKPFSQKVKKTHLFNTNRAVIGEDRDYPHRKASPPPAPLMEHDKPFKPAQPPKIGYNKCLAPFPHY